MIDLVRLSICSTQNNSRKIIVNKSTVPVGTGGFVGKVIVGSRGRNGSFDVGRVGTMLENIEMWLSLLFGIIKNGPIYPDFMS